MVRWTKNYLNNQIQRLWYVTQNQAGSKFPSFILQGMIVAPVLLKFFINSLDGGAECCYILYKSRKWLLHQRVVLPLRGNLVGWRIGQRGILWSSKVGNTKSYTGIIPAISTFWGLENSLARKALGLWEQEAYHLPAVYPHDEKGQQHPRLH